MIALRAVIPSSSRVLTRGLSSTGSQGRRGKAPAGIRVGATRRVGCCGAELAHGTPVTDVGSSTLITDEAKNCVIDIAVSGGNTVSCITPDV